MFPVSFVKNAKAVEQFDFLDSWTSLPWRVTTEPNFVTKTKSPWNKTTSSHPKLKPTKRPIAYGSIPDKETKNPITFKPKHPVILK